MKLVVLGQVPNPVNTLRLHGTMTAMRGHCCVLVVPKRPVTRYFSFCCCLPQVRQMVEDLGPAFIKVAQMLSTRVDVMPEPYILELQTLQDRVPPFCNEEAFRVMEEGVRNMHEVAWTGPDRFRSFRKHTAPQSHQNMHPYAPT